ncbi:MAG: Maf-like protein [Cytophagaceae bacterium]|nr:Maf-like protein [Cytophagaceae bacterium]
MNSTDQLILASNSPRRQQLLKEAGINFLIKTKDTKEVYPPSLPSAEVPLYLAKLKADAFRKELKNNETILTADTVVIIDNKILGKPIDENDAVEMLKTLSGRMHTVITGVCILCNNKEIVFHDTTEVYFKKLQQADIEKYVREFKPLDKAGSYGIQEWIGLIGVEKINGSYFNVMGLPVHRVVEELKKF